MLVRSAAISASLLFPSSTFAEARSEVFIDLLSRVPAAILSGDLPMDGVSSIYFADHEAALASLDPMSENINPRWESIGGLARVSAYRVNRHLGPGDEQEFADLVGFQPRDISAHLTLDAPPSHGIMLRLAPAAAAGVQPALLATGYTDEVRDGLLAMVRGGEDETTDEGNPSDFFSGQNGWSSRVAVEGDLVLQATSWPLLLGFAGHEDQGHPDLPALASALDASDWGDAQIVQAVVWIDQEGVSSRGFGGGIPYWELGVMADLALGNKTLTLVLFTYPDRATAEAAARRIQEGWAEDVRGGSPMIELAGAPATTQVLGDGPFVTAVAIRRHLEFERGWPFNPAYRGLNDLGFGSGLALFGPE